MFHKNPRYLSECPKCKTKTCETIESKKESLGQRRRKECKTCGHRLTTYEVSEEFFKESQKLKSNLGKIRSLLEVDSTPVTGDTCEQCEHMDDGICSFSFPDAGGYFASECNLFSKVK
jgi:hypothetical protein